MSVTSPPSNKIVTDDLALQYAVAAIGRGDLASGKQILLRILRSNPYNEKAWLWLSSVYTSIEQRKLCLQHVLTINPDNQAARRGLAQLNASTRLLGDDTTRRDATASEQTPATLPAALPNPPLSRALAWDERDKYHTTRRWFFLLITLVALIWSLVLGWLLLGPPIPETVARPLEPGVSLTVILAPLFIAAAAVERALESIFNIIENNWRALIAYLGHGMRWLKSAETELQHARQWLAEASGLYDQRMDGLAYESVQSVGGIAESILQQMEETKSILRAAERRLSEAEKNLSSLTLSVSYKRAKATASIVLGLLLGVIVARMTALQMFALLGLGEVPAKIDVLLTGLIIGSGSYPVHSLVGLLQQVKDIFDSAKGTLSRVNLLK